MIFNLAGLVLALELALLIAMVWQGVASTEAAARQEISETLNRGVERLRILAQAAEMTQESVERTVRTIGVSSASLRPILETSLAAFEQRPELSYLGVTLSDTGEYGCLERTADGEIWLWLFPGLRTDAPFKRCFVLTDTGFVLREESPADGYDPRSRPFYLAAVDHPTDGTWIPIYPWIIHSDDRDPLWGFSYVKAFRDDNGRPVAVLDTDFDMLALNSFLRSLASEYRCELQVVELGDTPRLIGDPGVGRVPLPPPAQLASLLGFSGDVFVDRMERDGERRWVAARRLTLKGGVSWLIVASRQGLFIEAPLRRQLYQVIGMGLAIAAGLVLVSARVARRFGKPLAELERRVADFGRSKPEGPAATAASATDGFRETQLLDEAFGRMAVAVRQREQELFLQNNRLRSHLENTPLAVIEWDAQARITNVNASAISLFRREATAMIGQPVLLLIAPDDRSRVEAVFDPARATGYQRRFSARGSTGDGPSPDCEWYVTKLEPEDTGRSGGCALVLDVSQLLEAEAAFRAADARFHVLFDRSPAANCLIRARDSTVMDLNSTAEKLFEVERERCRGKTLAELGIGMDVSRVEELRDRAARGAERLTLRTPGGRNLHCLVAVSTIEVDRELCRLWVAIDITPQILALEQKAVLEARTARQRDALIGHTERRGPDEDPAAALRRLSESSATTLAAARVSVWRYNRDQSELECRNLFDLRSGQHTSGQQLSARDYPNYFRALADGEIMAVDDACADPRTRDFVESYFRPFGIGAMLDVPVYIGGKVVGVLCHEHVGGPREWTADEKGFAVAMANLVSLGLEGEERRLLQEQFLRAQRMEAIGTLASGLAHDLNNILAPMLMAAALLKMKLTSPRDQKTVAMIESGAQRGSAIIRQLLTFGRGLEGARTSVQVRHLIKDLAHIVQETFPPDIKFASSAPANLWPVNANATQLHQVLLNLSVNARDAMPRGGRLSIAAENVRLEEGAAALSASAAPGPYVRLTVTDTGEGIPPAIIDRIFDPFFTTKPVGKGTGLGLSSVLSIVKDHGGFLKVASTPGAGTTFEIHLPALEAAAAAGGAESADQLPRGDGQLVLVVDDEAAMQQTTREILELHGYRVVTAENGETAIRRFIEHRGAVRLVLTDVAMPAMSGVELIRSLRILEKDLRFVVLSGSMLAERQVELVQLGVEHILPKPCDATRLLHAVHQALAG